MEYHRINCQGNVVQPNGLCLEFIYFYCVLFVDYDIDDCEGRQGIIGHLPKGLKIYPKQFSRFPYYEKQQIVHLFDIMYIGKNITETL